MITSLYIAGVADAYATQLELDDLNYPLNYFSWIYEGQANKAPKSNLAGSWKTRGRIHEMTIDIKGTILADTTASFWTKQKALKAKVIPPPLENLTEYDHTRFIATFDGDATTYYADCVLDQNIGALETTGAPTIANFELMFVCREGYWSAGLGGSLVVI